MYIHCKPNELSSTEQGRLFLACMSLFMCLPHVPCPDHPRPCPRPCVACSCSSAALITQQEYDEAVGDHKILPHKHTISQHSRLCRRCASTAPRSCPASCPAAPPPHSPVAATQKSRTPSLAPSLRSLAFSSAPLPRASPPPLVARQRLNRHANHHRPTHRDQVQITYRPLADLPQLSHPPLATPPRPAAPPSSPLPARA